MKDSNQPTIDAEEILQGILRWVEIESPSHDPVAVNQMVDKVEAQMQGVGATVHRTPGVDGYGDILTTKTPWGGDGPGILVLSHLDTVHPVDTINGRLPVRREGDKVYGPGIYDMKGGAYLAFYALRHLVREGKQTPLPITFLYVPEEEIGSPTSRAVIEAEAQRNKYVLVTEPAREGGKIVTARKGVGIFEVEVRGRPAHAGSRHADGRNAIREMAHQVLALEAMTDYDQEVTINVGMISGGTGSNVVPDRCRAEVDMRVPDESMAQTMCHRILGLRPQDPDTEVIVTGGMNRPAYGKNAGIEELFTHARTLAAEIGFELEDLATGGGSDGNFTAALGIPTLDGLGVDGHGAHTDYEHMFYSCLEDRARLLLRLFETLE